MSQCGHYNVTFENFDPVGVGVVPVLNIEPEKEKMCPFCAMMAGKVWMQNEYAYAVLDANPVGLGHTLVVPQRHVASVFDIPTKELKALWGLACEVRQKLQDSHHPDGFNIGVNDGLAAGQLLAHAHIHIIPRHRGDSPDPRGGVRWVLPKQARYWSR